VFSQASLLSEHLLNQHRRLRDIFDQVIALAEEKQPSG
jgi:hypothetical protein